MESKDLNGWLHEEHGRVNELIDRVAERVAVTPRRMSDDGVRDLAARFEALRAHLLRHFAMEEGGGYLTGVLERRPTLEHEVDRLRGEHRDLVELMDRIHAALQGLAASRPLLVRDGCARIKDLMTYLEEHERRENLLVLSAFAEDVGSAD